MKLIVLEFSIILLALILSNLFFNIFKTNTLNILIIFNIKISNIIILLKF